ncbi:MAG: nucleoside-diphosphate sugar epimerase/dehydratase [Flavobacterium sp.]|nr:nucleoside-diphosphate sugar epimerase/dehydratase [Flavobacterium sp.]
MKPTKEQYSRQLKKEFFAFMQSRFSNFSLANIGYLPRWIVFAMDVMILLFAAVITYYLLSNLTLRFYSTLSVPVRYGLMVAINTFYFFFFKTYSGIIRHSTFIDGIKLLLSTLFGFLTLLLLNYISLFTIGSKIYLTPGLIFNFVLNFSLLFLFRVLVKSVFERYFAVKSNVRLIPALVYGTDANAIAVANALKLEVPSRFKLLGFVSTAPQTGSKRLLDLPILQMSHRITVLMRAKKAQALILADTKLTAQAKRELVDDCLEYGMKVFALPLVTDWQNQQEISRKVQNIRIEDLLERQPIVLDKSLVSKQLERKCILVTGAAGSIGSELTRQILAFHPKELILVDQAETPLHTLSLEIAAQLHDVTVHVIIQDIRDYAAMDRLFSKYRPHKVYHAAAYKHVPLMEQYPDQAILVNIMGTKHLADLSYQYKVEKFVMVSTDKAVNPSNVMGASKRIAELYVQSLYNAQERVTELPSTKFITTRFGNVLGSNGSVVPLFTKQIQEGGPITITHPDIIRYFMTIPEACQLVLEAGAMGKGGEIYLFDMGEPVKIIDLARKMIRMAGYIPEKDIAISITGLRPGEKLYEELLMDTSKSLPTHHDKITVAQEPIADFDRIPDMIEQLIVMARTEPPMVLVRYMKEMVPEFVSNNSEYEVLDRA